MEHPVEAAEQLRKELGKGNDPLDVQSAAKELGCRVGPLRAPRGTGVEAELRPHPSQNRFYVGVDPTPKRGWSDTPADLKPALLRQRFRFRACHELGHALHFKRCAGQSPQRVQPWTPSEETWCDEFARALLVPPCVVEELGPKAGNAFLLQARFDVSLEVAVRALVAVHPRVEAALWFWPAEAAADCRSLIRQWTTAPEQRSLRPWVRSKLVATALHEESVAGSVPRLSSSNLQAATAAANIDRRQVVLVSA